MEVFRGECNFRCKEKRSVINRGVTDIKCNSPILEGFAFFCKLRLLFFKPRWDYQIKYARDNEKDSGLSRIVLVSCKWPIKITKVTFPIFFWPE